MRGFLVLKSGRVWYIEDGQHLEDVLSPIDSGSAVVSTTADWSDFAEYIRKHPSSLSKPAEELASQFDLEVNFVRSFLAAMQAPIQQESFLEVFARTIKGGIQRVGAIIRDTFSGLTARPLLCLCSTLVVAFGTLTILAISAQSLGLGSNFVFTGAAGALIGAVAVFSISTQAVCYYRHARARYAFLASALVMMGWFLFLNSAVTDAGANDLREIGMPIPVFLAMASAILTAVYFVFALTSTFFGSYAQYRRASREEVEVSRQELLNRLFMVDSRLQTMRMVEGWNRIRWVDRIRTSRTFFLNALLIGVALGMLEVSLLGTYSQVTGRAFEINTQMRIPLILSALGMYAVKIGLGGLIGFLGGRPGRSMSAILALLAGCWLATWFPLGVYGPKYAMGMLSVPNLLENAFWVVTAGLFTGYLALVEDRNYRNQRLSTDDLPSLLAEQIQLQWRLGLGLQATTVLVVDVAKSTLMKSNEDPLKVEFSFREYQGMVEEICARHGGTVLSTAGDGAVVGFARPESAVQSAREVLTELPGFNMRRNRLDTPFRLRIGIHAGQTEANLADAPFNEVIDIAAHIEGVAPIGGIAVSGVVREAVTEGVEFAEMARTVDGQAVFVVLNPTVEA
ncbi:hypothetical protein C0431_13980 [bacterium]|nr:hypothetical protein [bacterium]